MISTAISSSASPGGAIAPIIDTAVCSNVDNTLTQNITKYAPIQEWYNQGIENEDEDFVLNCGDSDSDEEDELPPHD